MAQLLAKNPELGNKRDYVREGYRMQFEDSYIAAIARRHNLTVVTGNEKDFRRPGIKVFNPFEEESDAE